MEIILAWSLSCAQYHGAVQRLYAEPFFQQPEHQEQRRDIHELFKSRTFPEYRGVELSHLANCYSGVSVLVYLKHT